MDWLIGLFTFVRDYEREWGSRPARRRNLRAILIALPVIAALAALIGVIAINLS